MSERQLIVEAVIIEEVFIVGVYGRITMHELEDIEKEIKVNYEPSNDWDNWREVQLKATFEHGGYEEPSYWWIMELGSKPCNPSVSFDLSRYLLQFDGEPL